MSTLAILCSGQGFQDAGMFDLTSESEAAAPVFAAATKALKGRDPRDIARKGGPAEMRRNDIAQALCCTQALAAWAALGPRVEARLVIAGYSVGELAAWGVAGAFGPEAILDLAVARAEAMNEATEEPSGLLAVRGLLRDRLERLCAPHDAHVAIVNAPDQMVVGGSRAALDAVAAEASDAGATRLTPLAVDVPSHTRLLRKAAPRLAEILNRYEPAPLPSRHRLLSGIDGAPVFDAHDGLAKLARQVAETVDWQACMESCRSAGATRALELGPGAALARLTGEVIGERESRSLAEFRTLDGAARWLVRPD